MASLFSGRMLLADREELAVDTERELSRALDNRVLLLYFGAWRCRRCRHFSALLRDFFLRLTDPFHVERPEQLGLVYVSRDGSREEQSAFLRRMPPRWLAVPYGDAFGRELELRFSVSEVPTVVVLRPDGGVIAANAVEEIQRLGPACFHNWRQAAELLDRNFLLAEDWEERSSRSLTEPLRRLKYRLDEREEKDQEKEDDGGLSVES